MKILVTGGSGFTGGHLVSRLVGKGETVRVLVRQSSNTERLEKLGVELAYGDVRDKDSIDRAVAGVDIVYHVAALYRKVGVPDSVYWDTNAQGTENMLQASLESGVQRFVHCSTVGVLSHIANPPADETFPYNPADVYQESKCEGEKLALKYHREYNLPVSVVRPAAPIYGPGDLRMLKLFKSVAKGRFVMLGSGQTLTHPVYIDDLVNGFQLCAEKERAIGEVYIIGGDRYTTLNEFVSLIAEAFNVPVPRIHVPIKPVFMLAHLCEIICGVLHVEPPLFRRRVEFFIKDRAFNITKARERLGYSPKMDLRTGVQRTAEWYLENGYI